MLVMLIGTLKKSKAAYSEDTQEEETPLTFEMTVDPPETPEKESENTLN